MITTYRQMPRVDYPGPDPAGEGKRRDRTRSDPRDWDRQLATWMLPRSEADVVRLWLVTVRVAGRGKITRALPSGHRIRLFEIRSELQTRVSDGWTEGPEFWLSHSDAVALWRDKDVSLVPLCDRIEVSNVDAA